MEAVSLDTGPLAGAGRVVLKIGSSLLVDADGELRGEWLASVAEEIASTRTEFIIVSSGAIALGRQRLGLPVTMTLAQKKACAAAGQSRLTQGYERAFQTHGRIAAQALLTLNDTEDRRRFLNARDTIDTLLAHGVIPVINENDTVATDEIRYGDNDRLAARVAQLTGADVLVLLSDIEGLYSADPRTDPGARFIADIDDLTPDVMEMGEGAGSDVGTGGMRTKLLAARIAMSAGCDTLIHRGDGLYPLRRLSRDRHTRVRAPELGESARRQWIVGHLNPTGRIHVDTGAAEAIVADKSLLLAGVMRAEGAFEKGDAVDVVCDGLTVARGLARYGHAETARILGRKGRDIEAVLGYTNGPALVHRDDLVRF